MKKRFLKILGLIIILLLVAVIALLFYLKTLIQELPSLDQIANHQLAQSTRIYDRTGQILLYEISAGEKRTVIPFDQIPDYLKQATITIEDHNFYQHPAFDWRAIIRTVLNNLIHNQTYGASTITQQLAKNAFLSPEKTLARKIKELILAIQLERHYTKDEILGFYLNQIPYGSGLYGVEAASRTFFGKSSQELNLAESALLAALPQAPSYYSPWGYHQDELKKRQEFILNEMYNLGFIDAEERDRARESKLVFLPPSTGNLKAPHFVMAVKDQLINHYGEEMVAKGGLMVITSLDYNLQQLAEKSVSEGATRNEQLYQGKNAALVAQDAKTGQILALVGSRDYFDIANDGNFDVASQGLRQPGSALKPFAYLTAFKKGFTPETIVFDVPTEFAPNNPACPAIFDYNNPNPDSACYHPQNFDKKFRGPVDFQNALAQSINIPSIKVLYLAGLENVLKTLHSFGITTLNEPQRYGLSLVLGGGEVKLVDLVEAYSVLSQEGIKHSQTMILKVEDNRGNILEQYQDQPEKIIESIYPQMINQILSDKDLRSPLFKASIDLTAFPDQEVALKTGTTNDYRDAWAMGYTPSLVVGVWAGNNDNTPLQAQGSSILAAVPIWHAFLSDVFASSTNSEIFTQPDITLPEKPILRGIVETPIHDTLFYIDKDNPQGPNPQNPGNDPQFFNWETGLMNWLTTNSFSLTTSTDFSSHY